MKGTEKRIPRSGTMPLRCAAVVAADRPMKVTSPLSALSLKAPWNCVTTSAQNPRRELRMEGILHDPRDALSIAYSRDGHDRAALGLLRQPLSHRAHRLRRPGDLRGAAARADGAFPGADGAGGRGPSRPGDGGRRRLRAGDARDGVLPLRGGGAPPPRPGSRIDPAAPLGAPP